MRVPESEWDYHEKEFGADVAYKLETFTGILGVFVLFLTVFLSVITLVFASPFLLLGMAELVSKTPSQWRVRWRRSTKETR